MNTIVVVNKYKEPEHYYIGRGSPLGNPFIMENKSDTERHRVIEEYRKWLINAINNGGAGKGNRTRTEFFRLYHWYDRGYSINLGCFCAPKACHGDVIKELLEDTSWIE